LECEQVEKSLCIAGKVMGWEGIDKWVEILDNRGKWHGSPFCALASSHHSPLLQRLLRQMGRQAQLSLLRPCLLSQPFPLSPQGHAEEDLHGVQ
jgi:hypothetical protein